MIELRITVLFPTYTSLNKIESDTSPLRIHPLEIKLFLTLDPALYFAGGRSSIFDAIVGNNRGYHDSGNPYWFQNKIPPS